MPWRSFLIYNAAGGIVWAIIYGCLGFFAGRIFHDNFSQVEQIASAIGWAGLALLITLIIFIFFLLRWRQKKRLAIANANASRQPGSADQS